MVKRLKEFLGLKRSVLGMLSMVVLVGLGEKMAERFLPIYLLALGSSALIPGLLNGLDVFLSAVYSFPGGWLTDKYGHKKALIIFNLVALFGYAIVIIFPSWIAVVIGSVFFLSWTSLSLPATMELISSVLPKNKRTMGVSVHSLVRRIPMALGPVVGGILIDRYGAIQGVRLSFGVAFVLGVVSIFLQQYMISGEAHVVKETSGFRKVLANFPKELYTLLSSDILIRFSEQIPYAYIAVWAMQDGAKVSGFQFGVLTAVEMVVALLIYIPVAYLADKGTKKPYVVITFINFTLFPLLLLISHSFMMLLLAFVVRGLKEFGEPTRKAIIMDLAPEHMKAATFGTYYLLRDVVVSVSAVAGAYLWQHSPATNLLTAAAFGVIGTLLFAIYGKDSVVQKSTN